MSATQPILAELTGTARRLPMTQASLQGLISMAAAFALSLDANGQCTGAKAVADALTDAFSACDDLRLVHIDELARADAEDWAFEARREEQFA